jgi:phosphoenolpyruvate-protein kinase (PTS system EI component)
VTPTDTRDGHAAAEENWVEAGRGLPIWSGATAEGVIADVRSPTDVIELLDADLGNIIVLLHTAGATMIMPIFADLAGVLCTVGNTGAHVAILAREAGLPCIVAADLSEPELDGRRVRLVSDGSVLVCAVA